MAAEGVPVRGRRGRMPPVRDRPVVSSLATVAVITGLMAVGEPLLNGRVPEAAAHGLSHLFVGVPLAVLAVLAWRTWPPARTTSPGRLGRRLVLLGLAGIVVGSFLEVLGARVDEPGAWPVEGLAHTAGQVVATLAVLGTAVGAVLALVAAVRDRAVPAWVAGVVAFGLAALLATVIAGAPGA